MSFYFCTRTFNKAFLKSLSKTPLYCNTAKYASVAGTPKINYKPYVPPVPEQHDDKNARLKRPLSPHLTIYQLQVTSMLSITHRITGLMLTGYVTVLGVGVLVLPNDISHYVMMLEGLNLSAPSLFLLKYIIAAPFGYHLANGIRHLYWDTGKGLTIKEVYTTGYAMLGLAALITIALAAL